MMVAMDTNEKTITESNKHFSHTVTVAADASKIWQIWTDVSNWKSWDKGLRDAFLASGDFGLSASGTIIALNGQKSKFTIVAYQQGRSYTMKTRLPFGSLYVRRFLTTKDGIVTFTHEVRFAGLSAGLFAGLFGRKFRIMLPEVMEEIKKIVAQ
ncbi:MAG: SRPBCC family protein [Bacteroidota bacterium]